ncbi:MAG: MOSC domain-containing protein [Hyphomonas sp.]|nr:MOSC domain-containing protein [Hyphomonas sp.]
MIPLSSKVIGLFVGKVESPWPGKAASAINKVRTEEVQEVGPTGFVNDAQADLTVHGGLDKAIHHYPADHYSIWQAEGEIPDGSMPAAFGENISASEFVETNICIGDVLRLGTALVQVSQGRQPCWKLNQHTNNPRMAFRFQQTGRTGWYYRVLERGHVQLGDEICLVDRIQEDWTVYRVTQARLTRKVDKTDVEQLSNMPELAENWREAFARMAKGNREENTEKRLRSKREI